MATHYTLFVNESIMLWIVLTRVWVQKMVQEMAELFGGILGWLIFGDVLKTREFDYLNIYKHI
jgi:hypothetical protein